MKYTFAILLSILSLNCNAQIVLKGYKCLFEEGQWPNKMAEMYKGNDTFLFIALMRDIWAEEDGDDPENMLKIGLRLCFFDNEHYIKTRDNLYFATGKNADNTYYYKVYVPDQATYLSLWSNKNDLKFSDKSKWLLSQIRKNRDKDVFIVNEKNEDCQVPPEFSISDSSDDDISIHNWTYRNYDHVKRNKFMGTWTEHGMKDDTNKVNKYISLAIDPDTSLFYAPKVLNLDLMLKNVYHADTLYLYVIASQLSDLQPKLKSLFAKCYIQNAALKIIYTQKQFRDNVKEHTLSAVLYKNSGKGIKVIKMDFPLMR